MRLNASTIVRQFQELKPQDTWSFRDVDGKDRFSYTHGYHRYPAKFTPHIVKKIIGSYARKGNELICDTFGGCGTTLVEAKASGRRSIGFDINPVAQLITQAKVTPIKQRLIEAAYEAFFERLVDLPVKEINHHERINYWFDKSAIQELDRIYCCIMMIGDLKVRRFFLCAFSHSLKNSSKWLMKSIKPTIDKHKHSSNPVENFRRQLKFMSRKNELFYNELSESGRLKTPAKMYRRDSTKKLPIKSSQVDLVITSPPYVTSYEYADLHQLSLLWFGDDLKRFSGWGQFSNQFNEFRKQFVGTRYKTSKKIRLDSEIAVDIVSDLEAIDRPLSLRVANYFTDMSSVFSEIHRVLKPGGKACLIIGNTELRGVNILNAEVAAEQMSRLGLHKVKFIKREILNKMITPWRDQATGKFTGIDNPGKKRAYEYEYVIVMGK